MSEHCAKETSVLQAKSLKRSHADTLAPIITHLKFELARITLEPFGEAHPSYPATLLHYHLLTESQLDSMAHYYDQSTPGPFTKDYPGSMNWDSEFLQYMGAKFGDSVRHRMKVRKFGNFIGLRGCETPIEEIDEKMRWEERKFRVTVKSPSEFASRRGFRRW